MLFWLTNIFQLNNFLLKKPALQTFSLLYTHHAGFYLCEICEHTPLYHTVTFSDCNKYLSLLEVRKENNFKNYFKTEL